MRTYTLGTRSVVQSMSVTWHDESAATAIIGVDFDEF